MHTRSPLGVAPPRHLLACVQTIDHTTHDVCWSDFVWLTKNRWNGLELLRRGWFSCRNEANRRLIKRFDGRFLCSNTACVFSTCVCGGGGGVGRGA